MQYPVVEFIAGAIFVGAYLKFDDPVEFVLTALYLSLLLAVFFIDWQTQLIPDQLCWPAIGLAAVYAALKQSMVSAIIGVVVGAGVIWLIRFIGGIVYKKEVMGDGDIMLAAALGVFLGWEKVVLALFISFLFAAVLGSILILLKKKKRSDYIPFGPYLVLGALACVFWGDKIIEWYLGGIGAGL